MKDTDRIHFMQLPLKEPCPFCGNTDQRTIVAQKHVYGEGRGEDHVELQGEVYWYVECFDCEARTGHQWDGDLEMLGWDKEKYPTGREAAIYMWNLRKEPKDETGT